MENIIRFQVEEKDGSSVDWVKIDKGNDEAVWMTQAEYDQQKAEQSTPNLAD
jgi:hypothetical protein